jgi:type I restriction enzyme, S subunit
VRNLPNGWIGTTLGELSIWGSGGTPSRSNSSYFGGDIPWVTISDLNDSIVSNTVTNITQEGLANSATKLAPAGSILIALYGSIGKLGIAGVPLTTNQAIAYSFPNETAFDGKYLFHYLRSERRNFLALGSGVTQKNIYLGDLKAYTFPLPPRAEQTRIVEKLEELLSGLDSGVAELKTAQKKLAQYRQSLLKAAVEGALTAEWRVNNKSTETGAQLLERILQERRARWEAKQLAKFKEQGKAPPKDWQKKYPEPVQPDTTDLPELPRGWVWASVEQLSEIMSGNTPKDAEAHASSNGVIPWFKVGDMNREGNEIWLSKSQINFTRHDALSIGMKLAPPGTIVFPKRGGAIATNKKRRLKFLACFDLNTMGLVPVDSSAEWLWWWFQGIDLGRLSDGSNIPQINNPDIAPLVIPVPPVAEQEMIIRQLKMSLDTVQAQEAAIDVSLKQSTAQRQNILKAAFAGQLVPQDPTDEPASELLARIRAERAAQQAVKKPRDRKAKDET